MTIDTSRSYATEANLMAALDKLGFAAARFVVVRNRAGRFTAIFNFSQITDGNVLRFASRGFMTIG